MKNIKIKLLYYFIIVPLKWIFFFLMFEKFVWYRRMKGGVWKNYFPRMNPYISLWTRGRIYPHEVVCKTEDYGEMIIKDNVARKKKNRKKNFLI